MILEDIAMLAVPNRRSEAYIDRLAAQSLYPSHVLVLSDTQATPGQRVADLEGGFLRKLQALGVDHTMIPVTDVNSDPVIAALAARHERYVIYSGPGGAILGKRVLDLGCTFIHVHPGRLPDFRGSTTIYYQLLASTSVGATAIFLEEEIDKGPVLGAREFDPPSRGRDLDYDYDSDVRADLMADVIARYARDGEFRPQPQPSGGETYFIMHPVLRHIARLKIEE